MGRHSRMHRENRERRAAAQLDRASRLEEELRRTTGDNPVFWTSRNCPAELRESHLEDILAFESVGTGTSLFDGLQEHGLDLPHPDRLDERQSAEKAREVMLALQKLQILLIGFEHMSARQFYKTLWNQTLWEGCYVRKREPGALTIIDVSHSMPRSEVLKILEEAAKAGTVN